MEKTRTFTVNVVNSKENKPVKKVNVKVFRLEKDSIILKQWTENLKNGTLFKRLLPSLDTDNNGNVTAELPEGVY